MRRPRRPARGITLLELLTTLAIFSITAGLTAAAAHAYAGMSSLRAASHEIASVFSQARSRALFRNAYSGVKWIARDGDLTLQIHDDGDGDGVRNDDIDSGVDPLFFGPITVKSRWPKGDRRLHPRLPRAGPEGEPGRRPLRPDPLRPLRHRELLAGRNCSPGSVWLGDGRSRQALVRLTPGSATIGIYEWVGSRRTWTRIW